MTNVSLRGKEIKNILTRFFFKKNEPCFQIILELDDRKEILAEYTSYPKYKRKMEVLKMEIENNQMIELPTVKRSVPLQSLKVAANI